MPLSSHQRVDNTSLPPPFIPREAFRLVLQLESQKTGAVDVAALERRFRVPPGYGDDESTGNERSASLDVPGPGAYDAPKRWPPAKTSINSFPSVAFLSAAPRSQSLRQRKQSKQLLIPAKATGAAKVIRPSTALAASPGKSFPRAQRWSSTNQSAQAQTMHGNSRELGGELYSSFRPSSAATFRHSPRNTHPPIEPDAPCVGSYEVTRFLDSDSSKEAVDSTGNPRSFGVSTEKRKVMWGPTFTPPSNAIPTGWNSSQHYAKQKRKVELQASKQNLAMRTTCTLRSTLSSPTLSRTKTSTNNSSASKIQPDNDPFAWLREQSNGEDRANFLASKFGLVDLVKRSKPSPKLPDTCNVKDTCQVETSVAPAGRLHKQLSDGQLFREGDQNQSTLMYQHSAQHRGQRLAVSCRLPGGMVVTVHTYTQRKLRQLKTAIARRCPRRFANENDFDVFSNGGHLLGSLESSMNELGLAGHHDCASATGLSVMVQIIPRQPHNRIPELNHLPATREPAVVESPAPAVAISSNTENSDAQEG